MSKFAKRVRFFIGDHYGLERVHMCRCSLYVDYTVSVWSVAASMWAAETSNINKKMKN